MHFLAVALSVIAPRPASAANFRSALEEQAKARNEYFEAVSSGKSKEGKHELRKKILSGSNSRIDKMMLDETQQTLKKYGVKYLKPGQPIPEDLDETTDTGPIASDTGSSGANRVTASQPDTSGPSRQDYVLDGNDVPKEVEFSGPSKDSKKQK